MSRYGKYISSCSRARQQSAIRALLPYLSRPGTISLGGGNPNASTFPFASLKIGLTNGDEIKVANAEPVFQYSGTNGMPQLLKYLKNMQATYHAHPGPSPQDLYVTTGSQDALTKAFEMCLGDEGSSLLVEDYTYSGSLAFLKPYGRKLVPVKTDEGGLLPDSLDKTLKKWQDTQVKKPKVLYTIPTGSNPTGISMDIGRRKALYQVAQEHDLLILEDDPYYYLQLDIEGGRLPSLYSMDVDSRVVRFDSLSKVMSSGLRLGLATGPSELIERLTLHGQSTNLHTSGVSQAVTYTLFEYWAEKHQDPSGMKGFDKHVDFVVEFYRAQRAAMLKVADKHLKGLCSWNAPQAGMFLWVKILNKSADFSTAAFAQNLIEKDGVLLVPGIHFSPTGEDIPYVRLSFSTASAQQMDEAIGRLAASLQATR